MCRGSSPPQANDVVKGADGVDCRVAAGFRSIDSAVQPGEIAGIWLSRIFIFAVRPNAPGGIGARPRRQWGRGRFGAANIKLLCRATV